MSNAETTDKHLNPEETSWVYPKRTLSTVRLTHKDLIQQIRQQTGLFPTSLVRLAHIRPKRENRITLMILQSAQSNQQPNPLAINQLLAPESPLPNAERVLLESLKQDSLGIDKAEVIEQVEHHLEQSEAPVLRAYYADMLYQSGMFERATHQAYRAAEQQPNALTLLTHGRSLSWLEPNQALEVLQQALQLAETAQEDLQTACLTEIVATLIRLGRYRSASQWAQWAVLQQARSGQVRSHSQSTITLLETLQIVTALSGTTSSLQVKNPIPNDIPSCHESQLVRIDLLVLQNNQNAALESVWQFWQHNQQRLHLASIALRLVPLLIANDQIQTALEVAQHTVELSVGLHPLVQRNAQLVHAIAISEIDPALGILALEQALQAHTKPLDALNLARAGLQLARVHEQLGQPEQAQAALQAAQLGLTELSSAGRRMLGGFTEPPIALKLELKFLGSSEAQLGGVRISLRRRFAEILAVLATHPQGLSGEQLSLAIYGEHGSLECCKTELSRLRNLIPIQTRPYRIGVPVKADFLELEHCLKNGQLEQAIALHHGVLLPGSDAPEVVRHREHLSESLRRATLEQNNPESLWRLAERDEHDLELWQRLLKLLRRTDPRHAIAQTRVTGLRRTWST